MAEDRSQWQAFVKTLLNIPVLLNGMSWPAEHLSASQEVCLL
jgi:hypothetical protein